MATARSAERSTPISFPALRGDAVGTAHDEARVIRRDDLLDPRAARVDEHVAETAECAPAVLPAQLGHSSAKPRTADQLTSELGRAWALVES